MRLSVCIITKNEASNIASCLDSVQAIADEIIVLDAFSTDATAAIAKQYTSHVYQKEWINDFSHARNVTISKATGDWILIIDADEVFHCTSDFHTQLANTSQQAFSIIRKEQYLQTDSRKKVSFPVTIIRLFKRSTNAQFRYPIHERLDDFFAEATIKVAIHPHCYITHHISTDTTFVHSKQERYLQQIDSYLAKHPDNEWLTYQKIKTLKFFERNEEVLAIAARFRPNDTKIRNATQVIVSQVYLEKPDLAKAIKHLQQIENSKNHPIVCMLLGDCFYKQKQFGNALRHYRKLKTSPKKIKFEDAQYIVTYCEKADKVYKIASVLYAKGLYFLCLLYLEFYKKYLQADSLLLMVLIFLKRKDTRQALQYVQKARIHDPTWLKLIELEKELS